MSYQLVLSKLTYLFSWDNIPGNDNEGLVEFLNRGFDIEWVKTAKIEKIEGSRTIKMSTEKNFLLLSLNDEKTKVNLEIDDGRTDKFVAKMENGKLNIYEITKGVGENVFFNDMPSDYEVYVLYYAGTSLNKDLADKLRDIGNIAGKNLFVNIAKLDDPNYRKIANKFGIRTFPTIIITAVDNLASPPSDNSTAYVKMENKRLLSSPDIAAACVDKMFNLFIEGKIAEAMREQKRDVHISNIKGVMNDALRGMLGYLKEWDISFSFIEGRLELKPKGG